MTDSVESVLQKLAEEIGLMQQLGADRGLQYRQHKIEEKLRSALEPTLAENEKLRELLREAEPLLYGANEARNEMGRRIRRQALSPSQTPAQPPVIKVSKGAPPGVANFVQEVDSIYANAPSCHFCGAAMRVYFRCLSCGASTEPSPTPAPDTNTQSLCSAKPSPDSATPRPSCDCEAFKYAALALHANRCALKMWAMRSATTGKGEQG